MSIFSAKAEAPPVTGSDVLRQAVRGRKMGLAVLAKELHLAAYELEAFVAGGDLPADKLSAIAREVFGGHAQFDPEIDRLRPVNRAEPKAFCTAKPPSVSEMNLDRSHLKPRALPKTTAKPQPAQPKRPGWAE
jgi:hypothetical protein